MNDERTALDDIRKCLEKYFQETKEECVVYEFENPNVFLHEYSSKYDLIFLDIQMAGKDGFSVAKEIHKVDKMSALVFVTNMTNLAVKGYEVGASDFIVKSLEYFSFKNRMNRVMERARQNKDMGTILIQTEEGKIKIRPSSIHFVVACAGVTPWIVIRGKKMKKETLTEEETTPSFK